MNISFSKTQRAIISRSQEVTRRDNWDSKAAILCNAWDKNSLIHNAYSSPPSAGGKLIAKIKLTCRPYKEKLADMPESDVLLEAVEGIETKEQFLAMFDEITEVWVIRFEVVCLVTISI